MGREKQQLEMMRVSGVLMSLFPMLRFFQSTPHTSVSHYRQTTTPRAHQNGGCKSTGRQHPCFYSLHSILCSAQSSLSPALLLTFGRQSPLLTNKGIRHGAPRRAADGCTNRDDCANRLSIWQAPNRSIELYSGFWVIGSIIASVFRRMLRHRELKQPAGWLTKVDSAFWLRSSKDSG